MKGKKIDLDPYSRREEWLSWRRRHITATASAVLLGLSHYKTKYQLYEEMMYGKETEINAAMKRGMELEEEARNCLAKLVKEELNAACYESIEFPFMGASLDAINKEESKIYEIKCPGKMAMKNALKRKIPEIYRVQCQKQMLVAGIKFCWLFFYESENVHILLPIAFDSDLINQIIKVEKEFWFDNILTNTPPALTNKDYQQRDNVFENKLALKWLELKEEADESARRLKVIETQLKELAKGFSVEYTQAHVKLTQISRKGNVDWPRVCTKWKINEKDLEKYRKEKTQYVKIHSEV